MLLALRCGCRSRSTCPKASRCISRRVRDVVSTSYHCSDNCCPILYRENSLTTHLTASTESTSLSLHQRTPLPASKSQTYDSPSFAAMRVSAIRTPIAHKLSKTHMLEEWSRYLGPLLHLLLCTMSSRLLTRALRSTLTSSHAHHAALPPRKSKNCTIIGWPTVSMLRCFG